MKRIAFPVFLSFSVLFFSCGDTSQPSAPSDVPQGDSAKVSAHYICPCGHCGYPGGTEPGDCPKCGMKLEQAEK